ncbi:MAG: hypothetical protein KBS83_00980, partial [Lachnospiraceae bacterium]|nr:hypothetical protein [Candidatus Equihabitans merdae]
MKRILLAISVLMMGGLLAGFSFFGLGGAEETTLMVYMTGSDLESKGACATNDMQEMLNSGVDLSHTNLLVYTGGAKTWHNEKVTISPEVNGLYHLTASGFEEIDNFPLESMGDPANLTRFLDYAVEKYPADKYDLVFWDHGNGPVIGYGMDFLYNKDSLTLPEIRQGLEASPFGPDKKLDIIGFDACLMASAELAYTVSDYADYLISSQETEPSFGWNYAFLKNIGKHSGKKLAKDITDAYMNYCNATFKKNALYNTDVTISVMDLSKAKAVQAAVNALFE